MRLFADSLAQVCDRAPGISVGDFGLSRKAILTLFVSDLSREAVPSSISHDFPYSGAGSSEPASNAICLLRNRAGGHRRNSLVA